MTLPFSILSCSVLLFLCMSCPKHTTLYCLRSNICCAGDLTITSPPGKCKAMCTRDQVSCPANAEQGMTCLAANDATGQSFLPGKYGRVHDLVTCQPSTPDPLSEFLGPLENLARFRAPRTCNKSRTHKGPVRQLQLHDSRGLGVCLVKK